MKHIITIGREYGSGGRLIGQKLSQSLSIPFYDKKLIEMTVKETGLSEKFIQDAEHYKTSSFLYNIYFSNQSLPVADQVFIAESNIIKQVASEGSCVIVGCCSDYILKKNPHCIRTFIYAPFEDRLRRAIEEYRIDAHKAQSIVQKKDKERASYYNYFTTARWGHYENYDLSINSNLGIDAVVHFLKELVKYKEEKL